jgi:hypothetical protein
LANYTIGYQLDRRNKKTHFSLSLSNAMMLRGATARDGFLK